MGHVHKWGPPQSGETLEDIARSCNCGATVLLVDVVREIRRTRPDPFDWRNPPNWLAVEMAIRRVWRKNEARS